ACPRHSPSAFAPLCPSTTLFRSLVQHANTAVAQFADGTEFEADLIVGADGVRSVIREQLWGQEAANYTGHMCWRALVNVDKHPRSEEHTSELQSRENLVCRLLLE